MQVYRVQAYMVQEYTVYIQHSKYYAAFLAVFTTE